LTSAETRPPPDIPGYVFIRDLGAGGYSVVYLYRQASLNREVAVKVLRDNDLNDVVRERFTAEATAMVQLGNHPNIVDVLDTGIALDGSRYLIMRYYAGGNLAQRAARRGLQAAEVLDVGIKLADAVKTVHAAHLVHRDIKPANILIDDANRNYRLSDFGIAGRLVSGHAGDAFGISVPWSAPEVVRGETGGSVAADVYSLGATLWHLLAGQSPFRVLDGDNRRPALEARICAGQLPPMPRRDVPPALTDLLVRMMATTWFTRPALADVARELTLISGGVAASPFIPPTSTPLRYGGDSNQQQGLRGDDLDRTADRPRTGDEVRLSTTAPDSGGHGAATDQVGAYGDGAHGNGVHGSGAYAGNAGLESDHEKDLGRRWILPTLIGIGVLAAAIGVAAVGSSGTSGSGPGGLGGSGSGSGRASATNTSGNGQDPGQLGEDAPPGPVTVAATRANSTTLQFTWTYSAALANDSFKWQTSDGAKSGVVTTPTLELPDPPGVQICVQIKVVRADGSDAAVDWSQAGCSQ
jgi:tRNA A-37 threonylcarbamoyl transferase component Bud32